MLSYKVVKLFGRSLVAILASGAKGQIVIDAVLLLHVNRFTGVAVKILIQGGVTLRYEN